MQAKASTLIITVAAVFCIASGAMAQDAPTFSLAWSEYPSWSVFGVAHEVGLIDGAVGKQGPVEKKWGVDIELKQADYDACLVLYGAAQADAICVTNMDALNPALSRPSAAILPTSTSDGADACIVTSDITEVSDLKGKQVRGLALSVSEYCFVRNLELLGEDIRDYRFVTMDPGAAALAMQQKQDGFHGIVVWNPFVLETLEQRKDCRVLFDSTTIPNEIIDMVVVAQASLDKPGGEAFAKAVIDTYYQLNVRLNAEETRDETLIALGEKFSNLGLQPMRKVVKQTKFYDKADVGIGVYTGDQLKETMGKVVEFCLEYEIVEDKPSIGYGAKSEAPDVALRFDPSYMKAVAGE